MDITDLIEAVGLGFIVCMATLWVVMGLSYLFGGRVE